MLEKPFSEAQLLACLRHWWRRYLAELRPHCLLDALYGRLPSIRSPRARTEEVQAFLMRHSGR